MSVHYQIVAVAARDLQHAEDFAKRHNIPRAYGSYDELAKNPDVGELLLQHTAQCLYVIQIKSAFTHVKYIQATKSTARLLKFTREQSIIFSSGLSIHMLGQEKRSSDFSDQPL